MSKFLFIISIIAIQTSFVYAASDNATTVTNLNALALQVKKLDKRLQKIERLLNNKILLETVNRIDDLQVEIKEVRGDVEGVGFKVQSASKRNKNFFIDTDRRLNTLEVAGKNTTVPLPIVPVPSMPAISVKKDKVKIENKPLVVDTKVEKVITPAVKVESKPKAVKAESKLKVVKVESKPKVVINKQSSVANPDERKDYMASFNYLKQGRYQKSLIAFTEFLEKHPNGRYADNAQYWLAESNYVSRFFDMAIIEFNKVITLYPSSPKVSDARLKLGYCYYERGMWAKAKNSFNELILDYPETSVANLAKRRLKRIEREGH